MGGLCSRGIKRLHYGAPDASVHHMEGGGGRNGRGFGRTSTRAAALG